jgi:hypothetical protein
MVSYCTFLFNLFKVGGSPENKNQKLLREYCEKNDINFSFREGANKSLI